MGAARIIEVEFTKYLRNLHNKDLTTKCGEWLSRTQKMSPWRLDIVRTLEKFQEIARAQGTQQLYGYAEVSWQLKLHFLIAKSIRKVSQSFRMDDIAQGMKPWRLSTLW